MDSSVSIYDLGIDQWSVDDRLRLIGEIWDSLEAPGEIPEWQKRILDERISRSGCEPRFIHSLGRCDGSTGDAQMSGNFRALFASQF
jgi:hypothetical protein